MKQRGFLLLLKRSIDIVAASIALIIASPVMVAAALLIRLTMGSPVLFAQERPGRDGRLFRFYKFRTMRAPRSAVEADVANDAQRITAVGELLRRWSIDELPQLLNVLRGDLSLVGPRPLLPQYLERYSQRQFRRHEVVPGMTGWAQIHGRNTLDWDEKFELDVWYVDHWSPLLDLKIIAKTFAQLFRRNDIAHPGHVSMPEFLGTQGRHPH